MPASRAGGARTFWSLLQQAARPLVLAIALAVLAGVGGASPATAAPLAGSSYDSNDGDQASDPATVKDWQDDQGQVRESPDELAPSADVCFGGGLKENSPGAWFFNTSASGCEPGKSNLFATWSRSEMTATTSFLHLAFKRNSTTGNTFITFELNQTRGTWTNSVGTSIPCRSNGDLLLSYEVGGSSLNVTVYRWQGDGTGPAACPDGAEGTFTPGATQQNLGTMNASPITNYLNAASYGASFEAGSFGEGQIDLPAALASMGQSRCFSFLQVQAHTRSSEAISSALIDYVKPVPAYISSCSASGTVYADTDRDGSQDSGEAGIAGRAVYVDLNDDGDKDGDEPSATTDADGYYVIAGVPSGAHTIREVVPAGTVCTNSGGCAYSRTFVEPGNSTANDFGNYAPTGRISGTVFDDSNGDGDRDSGEGPLAGVTVRLLDTGNQEIATTQTDPSGVYSFSALPAGDYQVDPQQAPDRLPTSADPKSVALTEGEQKTVDFGYRLPNRAPTADDESAETTENDAVAVDVLEGDTDPDGDALVVTESTRPANGTVDCTESGVCTYTPNAGFVGTDSFEYTVDDRQGATDTGSVTVTVTEDKPAPSSVGDLVFNDANGDGERDSGEDGIEGVTVRLLDGDGDELDSTETDAEGLYGFDGLSAGDYQVEVAEPGGFVVTAGANRGPVTLSAGEDERSADFGLQQRNAAVGGTVFEDLDGDSERDLDERVLEGATVRLLDGDGEELATTQTDGNGLYGFDNLAGGDYQVKVDEPEGFDSEAAQSVSLSPGEHSGADFALDPLSAPPSPENRDPLAVDDGADTTANDPVEIDVLANDSDPDGDALVVTESTRPANGTVDCTESGVCTYTPSQGFTGADSFEYTIADRQGGTDTATVTIEVREDDAPPPENREPNAADDSVRTSAKTPVAVRVLANDSDADDDPLSVVRFTQSRHGGVGRGPDGDLVYSPDGGFTGTDSFTYTVSDGRGGTDTATVTITVSAPPAPANRPPAPRDDTDELVVYGGKVVINVLENDTDLDGDRLTMMSFTQPKHGKVDCTPQGICTYTADPGHTGPDSFSYVVSDGNGGTRGARVTMEVSAPPQPSEEPEEPQPQADRGGDSPADEGGESPADEGDGRPAPTPSADLRPGPIADSPPADDGIGMPLALTGLALGIPMLIGTVLVLTGGALRRRLRSPSESR